MSHSKIVDVKTKDGLVNLSNLVGYYYKEREYLFIDICDCIFLSLEGVMGLLKGQNQK